MDELGAFLGVSVLVIVTPGQDTALTIRSTMLGGRRGGNLHRAGCFDGADDLGARGERGRGRDPACIRAIVPGAPPDRRRVSRLSRRPVPLGRLPSGEREGPDRSRRSLPTADLFQGVSAGRAQQPRQSQDGGVLYQSAPTVRTAGRLGVPHPLRPRLALRPDDPHLAHRVRLRGRASAAPPGAAADPASTRRPDRSGTGRTGAAPGDGAALSGRRPALRGAMALAQPDPDALVAARKASRAAPAYAASSRSRSASSGVKSPPPALSESRRMPYRRSP